MLELKTYSWLHFKRFKASKVFRCYDCGETIEVGSHYWRRFSMYKYCDRCYVRRLNAHGWGLAESNSPNGQRYYIDQFWFTQKDRSLESQLRLLQGRLKT